MFSYRYSFPFLIVVITVCVAFISAPAFSQVSKQEKKITQAVDKNNAEALKLLEQAVNINSGSMNFEGVYKVGELFKAQFDALGMETQWIDGKAWGRSGHLVARQRGKGPTMLLIGHLDTVFEPSSPFQKYEVVDDKIVRGPGVADMKGGDVIIIYALKALKDANVLKDMNIIVVMTGDEELSGRPLDLARKALIDAAKDADIALGFENSDGNPKTIVVSRRSSSGWELKVTGNAAHSSQIFTESVGAGAIYEASRILNSFYEELSTEENLTFNPGMIIGGTLVEHDADNDGGSAFGKSNVVSKDVVVSGDIRAISPGQLKKAQSTMTDIVSKHRPGTIANIVFGEGYPPLAPTEGNYKLLLFFDQVSRDLGYGGVTTVNPRKAGAADISFTAPYVDMAIDGLGLGGADDHTVNETGDISSLPMQTKRAAVLMYRIANDKMKLEVK